MDLPKEFVSNSTEYFDRMGLEIDWDNEGIENSVSVKEEKAIMEILTCEMSYYALRRVNGGFGANVDCMARLKRNLIKKYQKKFKREYQHLNQNIVY